MDIEKFIDLIAQRLPDFTRIGTDTFFFSGKELKLTGVKEFKGKALVDSDTYGVDFPRLKKMNHRKKMRDAWLANGMQGVYDYIEPYIGYEQLEKVKSHFMKVAA